jgi:hypothetical protein
MSGIFDDRQDLALPNLIVVRDENGVELAIGARFHLWNGWTSHLPQLRLTMHQTPTL